MKKQLISLIKNVFSANLSGTHCQDEPFSPGKRQTERGISQRDLWKTGSEAQQACRHEAVVPENPRRQDEPSQAGTSQSLEASPGSEDTLPRRHQRMIENLHREARKGNREACFFMANLYFPGNWTRRNEDQAFEWYLKAAIPKLKEARVY